MMKNPDHAVLFKVLFICAMVVAGVACLTSCGVDPRSASRALEAQGMKNVEIEGYSWFGCGKEDLFRSNFSATGTNGQRVSGAVCQGMLKGTTVRFD